MRRPWVSVAATLVVAAGLAGGTAIVSDRVFSAQTAPPPTLKGVSAETLSQMGIRLSSAQAPLYCGVVSMAFDHGLQPPTRTGCPVSRVAAEAAFKDALPGWLGSGLGVAALAPANAPAGTVQDAALVRASAPRQPAIGRDRVVWLFVVQGAFPAYRMRPMIACPTPIAGTLPRPACRALAGSSTELVFVDAESSRYLTALPVTAPGGVAAVQVPARTVPDRRSTPISSPLP